MRASIEEAEGFRCVVVRRTQRNQFAISQRESCTGLQQVHATDVEAEQPHLAHAEETGHDPCLGGALQDAGQIADMVGIGMAQPDPAQVGEVDLRLEGIEERVAECGQAGVDQNRLTPLVQESVDRQAAHAGQWQEGGQYMPVAPGLEGVQHRWIVFVAHGGLRWALVFSEHRCSHRE